VHCSHGEGNGLLLPYVMKFNLPERKKEFALIANWLGASTQGLDEDAAANKAVEAVEKLRSEIGIPGKLSLIGVKENQLHEFAVKSHSIQRILRVNPRTTSVEDLEKILRDAF
jgi:alcohol dehydrogenase class IV